MTQMAAITNLIAAGGFFMDLTKVISFGFKVFSAAIASKMMEYNHINVKIKRALVVCELKLSSTLRSFPIFCKNSKLIV